MATTAGPHHSARNRIANSPVYRFQRSETPVMSRLTWVDGVGRAVICAGDDDYDIEVRQVRDEGYQLRGYRGAITSGRTYPDAEVAERAVLRAIERLRGDG